MIVYRIELNKDDGIWYDKNQNFKLADYGLNHIPMPKENEIYKTIYKSSCASIENLLYWIPKDIQDRLKQKGYKLVEYETKDYFEREHGEVCFNKTNYIYRIEKSW